MAHLIISIIAVKLSHNYNILCRVEGQEMELLNVYPSLSSTGFLLIKYMLEQAGGNLSKHCKGNVSLILKNCTNSTLFHC